MKLLFCRRGGRMQGEKVYYKLLYRTPEGGARFESRFDTSCPERYVYVGETYREEDKDKFFVICTDLRFVLESSAGGLKMNSVCIVEVKPGKVVPCGDKGKGTTNVIKIIRVLSEDETSQFL